MSDDDIDLDAIDPYNAAGYVCGRPIRFSPERAARVLEAIRRGLTYKLAASYAGISYSTLNRWRIAGDKAINEGIENEMSEFWRLLHEANGEAAYELVDHITASAVSGNAKAAMWILERRFPQEYGKNAQGESGMDLYYNNNDH